MLEGQRDKVKFVEKAADARQKIRDKKHELMEKKLERHYAIMELNARKGKYNILDTNNFSVFK